MKAETHTLKTAGSVKLSINTTSSPDVVCCIAGF